MLIYFNLQEQKVNGKFKFSKTTKGKLEVPEVLFNKLEEAKDDPFQIINLKVAEVLEAKPHPNADKLLVLKIKCDRERTLCAGLKQYFTPEQLAGKHVIIVSNLKPALLRGIESQGMLLAAEKDGKVVVLEAPNSKAGDQVFVDKVTPMTAEITIDDFAKIKLTTKNGKAIYGDKQLKTAKEDVVADVGDGASIR